MIMKYFTDKECGSPLGEGLRSMGRMPQMSWASQWEEILS